MAIYKYNHAIGKTQSGGVQLGLLRDLYQSPVGNKEPVDPAARHAKKPSKKMNIDPAIASSVFVTTITDVIGFVSFLGVGAYFL